LENLVIMETWDGGMVQNRHFSGNKWGLRAR
jgi:hypothetical protein